MASQKKIFDYFSESKVGDKTQYSCNFCKNIYTCKHATRFSRHLANKCTKCPQDVTSSFKLYKNPVNQKNKKTAVENIHNESASVTSLCERSNTSGDYDPVKVHQALAKAIYVSGAPLSLLENPLWVSALQELNPTYSPPSRKVLSTSLLEKEYEEMRIVVTQKISEANVLHLAIDGWSNLRNESILNVIIFTPKPYFYKFVATEDHSHTAEYIFKIISEILDEIGSEKFLVIISDNAANMVKCGRLIQNKYENITWIGCLAHTLHLWINDILKLSKVQSIFAFIVEIIKTIKHSQILSARFKKLAEEQHTNITLHLPVKTRWGSYLFCLESFIKSKMILQNMVINDANEQLKKYKKKILDEAIWHEFTELEQFLKPIVHWITKLEGDYSLVYLVHKAFGELEEILGNPLTEELFKEDIGTMKSKFLERKKSALKPLHMAASILDPNNQGINLTTEENLEGCEVIINTNISNRNQAQQIFEELNEYKNRLGVWEQEFVWQMGTNVSPIMWWQTLFPKTLLGITAKKILSVPATSASVERSFSTFSNIHTKKRNKLKAERAGKICFISHNWKLINKTHTTSNRPFADTELVGSSSQLITDDLSSESEDDFCPNGTLQARSFSEADITFEEYEELEMLLNNSDDREDPLDL